MDLAKEFIEENKTIEENYNLEDDMDDERAVKSFQDTPKQMKIWNIKTSWNETRSLTSKISDAFKNFF